MTKQVGWEPVTTILQFSFTFDFMKAAISVYCLVEEEPCESKFQFLNTIINNMHLLQKKATCKTSMFLRVPHYSYRSN